MDQKMNTQKDALIYIARTVVDALNVDFRAIIHLVPACYTVPNLGKV